MSATFQPLRRVVSALRGVVNFENAFARRRKASPFRFTVGGAPPTWRLATPADPRDRFRRYVEEGYATNSVIYSAVQYKALNQASVPVWAATGDPDNPVYVPADHPLATVLRQPNPSQTHAAFQAERVTYLNLAGNSYTFEDRDARGHIRARYNLRPDRVWIIPGINGIQGYYYVPEGAVPDAGVPILPENMSHVKFTNPADPLMGLGYGMPPLMAAAAIGDIDNSITHFIKQVMDGGGLVRGAIKSKLPLDEDGIARIRKLWRDRYGDMSSWGDVAVFDQEGEYQRIGMSFEELGFELIDARNEARLTQIFGIPPILIGAQVGLKHGTYSNYEQARRTAWEDRLQPELMLFADADNAALATDGAFVVYDFAAVPALRHDLTAQIAGAHQLWQMGVPANQALTTVGLKLEVPGGDTAYVPNGVAANPTPVHPDP